MMEETVVTATRGERELGAVAAAVSIVGEEEIQQGQQQLTLDESLSRVPGVFLQNRHNFSQAQRISIRGFGARSPFGVRGIRLIIDGVPATMPDGQGNVDEIDLGSASRIEVIRGPASSLYGTASGGVINVFTEDGPEDPYIQGRFSLGEFGYRQYQLKTAGQYQRLNYVISGSLFEQDGYRDNAFVDRRVLNSKLRLDLDSSSDITASLNLLDIPDMGDPGALNAGEAMLDRRAANPGSLNFDGSEGRSQQRFGLVYRKAFGEQHEVTLRNYYTLLDFENKLPFPGGIPRSNGGQVEFDRLFIGGGGQYAYTQDLLDYTFRFVAGFDIDYQQDDRRRYVNTPGGTRGDLSMDQREEVNGNGIYVQSEFAILENVQLTLGARYDEIAFEVTDRFFLNESGDDSGTSDFNKI
ncbi:MAG: TonB-dependent receptor, partial [Gammaproteobacteria bacterium]